MVHWWLAGSLWPAFTPYPFFSGIPKVTRCSISAFNAHRSKVTTVVVEVGVLKIYVAAMEALNDKERQDETQFNTKIGGKTSLGPSYFAL
jgi:hypothetical protein